ncbi:MAG: hypothetical protein OEQ53_17385 [Saprospiraceae bacterium]|nr:hypothetical protein [Saprospiraceae bacterium]
MFQATSLHNADRLGDDFLLLHKHYSVVKQMGEALMPGDWHADTSPHFAEVDEDILQDIISLGA